MRRSRGQVLVLACLAMLMVGLMLMLSFNVTNAIHERTRIQATADAQAMSTATLEARAFNTMAFTNRAIAGAMVGEMAIHAWWVMAENEEGQLNAGYMAFMQVSGMEYGQCNWHAPQHCVDGLQAMQIGFQFKNKASSYGSKLNSLEQSFKSAVKGLNDMMEHIHADQKTILDNTKAEIASGSATMGQLKKISAPNARYLTAVDGMNVSEFACALEGSKFDDKCNAPSWKPAGSLSSAGSRGKIMESAAMAIRPRFETGNAYWRSMANDEFNAGGAPAGLASSDAQSPMPLTLSDPSTPKDIQSSGSFTVQGFTMPKTWARNNKIGAEISPGSPSIATVSWRHGSGMWMTSGSGASPVGKREGGDGYVGLPCTGDNCFINFRAGDAASDYGQPVTYGALSQDLRLQLNGKRGPWELNQQGTVKIKLQRNHQTRLVLVPQGVAYAVAKGKTYFHQLGPNGWATPPNMFDPFWRAKLQAFGKEELKTVLSKIGDSQGSAIVGGGGPVEGKLQ